MFQYALAKNTKNFLHPSASRLLFTRAKRSGESELILTNNAGIFGVHWSLNHHSQVEHPDVHVVCFPFWLDKINPHHENRDWGQTLLGFPTAVRALFKKIYPNYPIDKLVTWKMMQELRNFTVDELKSMSRVHLYDLRSNTYPTDYNGLFEMTRDAQIQLHFSGKSIVTVPGNTEVYNWVKIPRLHGIDFLPERSHTELYTCSPETVPSPILVMGSGLSVVWLQRDFPQHKIIAVVPDKNAELPQISANAKVDYDKIIKITANEILETRGEQIIIKLDNQIIEIPKTNCVSAIGYLPYTELTSKIPDNQKTERLDIPAGSWLAPENIPVGSLTQSLIKFFEETENLDATFELQFHHTPSIVEVLQKRFHNDFGIALKEAFFDKLKFNIPTLKDPLDEAEELNLFVSTFKDAQNPSSTELVLFEKAIRIIQQDRTVRINHHRSTPQTPGNTSNTDSKSFQPAGSRLYSTGLMQSPYQGMLPEKVRLRIQELVLVFFKPEKAKVQDFDRKRQIEATRTLTAEDRNKMQSVLQTAKRSQKTFSAY